MQSGDLRLLWDFFFFFRKQALEKVIRRSGVALFLFFEGGPWKRKSGSLRLLWDYFLMNFYRRQALKNAVWRFEIALRLFSFFWSQALKKGVWRFEIALGLFSNFLGGNPLEKGSFL